MIKLNIIRMAVNFKYNNKRKQKKIEIKNQMFTKKIQSSRANGAVNINGYTGDSNGFNTDRFPKYQDSRQINSNMNQRKTFTSGQFTHFKKGQSQRTSQLVIRQCDPSELNIKKNTSRQSQEINYQYGSNKKEIMPIGSRKKYDSNLKQPMVQIHYSDRQNSQSRYSSNFQTNSSVQSLSQEFFKLKDYILLNFNKFNLEMYNNTMETRKARKDIDNTNLKIENIVNQVQSNFNRQKNQISDIRNQCATQIKTLSNSFFAYVNQQEQKMENMVIDGSMKRSKHFDEFGVDLKSSSQCLGGMGTSMSVNFGGQNLNLKLYNQVQTLKNELQDCKQKISSLQTENKWMSQMEKKEQKSQTKESTIQIYEVQKMIADKLMEFKKSLNLNQKWNQFQGKLNSLNIGKCQQQANIKGMNEQFNRVLNTVIIPRQKALQQKVKTCQQSIKKMNQKEQNTLKNIIQLEIKLQIQKQVQNIKILKIRNKNQKQAETLAANDNHKETYMVDENNCLLDSRGYYLVQNGLESGTQFKKKIKIQNDMLYLLEVNGMQIKAIQ